MSDTNTKRQIRWGALVSLAELIVGVGLLSYGGYLVYEPLAWCVPGVILTIDAFFGGRK